jgi:hypothetical protein
VPLTNSITLQNSNERTNTKNCFSVEVSMCCTFHSTQYTVPFARCSYLRSCTVWASCQLPDSGHEDMAGCSSFVSKEKTSYSPPVSPSWLVLGRLPVPITLRVVVASLSPSSRVPGQCLQTDNDRLLINPYRHTIHDHLPISVDDARYISVSAMLNNLTIHCCRF